ncbi:IQ domain-containing protein G [Fasciola hepatica]|uniref:IQ domain-containing protein G n=1 Tax=Fasciola hepatica TaxID=6192 RepID=A0A4E0S0W6_FASHE|nr:IQ domain-containing protein G [Fasciola hepatica]
MALTGSEATSITAVISDAVTELRTLINLIDIRQSSTNCLGDDQFAFDENIFIQMEKVLSKYSNPAARVKLPSKKGIQSQYNNSAILDSSHVEPTIEDLFNSREYTEKLETDMIKVTEILAQLAEEVDKKGTFQVLEDAVKHEEEKFQEIEKILERERMMRARVKTLRDGIDSHVREGQQLIEHSRETIAHLKDQVQEMKARSAMEEKYMTKYSNVRLAELESRFFAEKRALLDEIAKVTFLQDQETRASEETKSFMRDRLAELTQLEEYWRTRSESDVQKLRHKLDILRSSKIKDFNRLHELTQQYQEYENVVLVHRIALEKARQQAEQIEMEEDASQKIQNWWRCILVKKEWGPYDKKKKKKKRGKRGKKTKK